MPIEARKIHYSGRVQGVGFRVTAQRVARPFGIGGYVRNLPDGRVEMLAQGELDALNLFLDALYREMRPNIASVDIAAADAEPDLAGDLVIRS
ncbi:MAG: acylphosphatase [Isosphaeraceae bacterium]|nr:acylphosphatase [Isosphaeraceae bacterium]